MFGVRASIRPMPALAAGALLCAGLAAPAHAQGDESRKASNKDSTRMMLEFAECTARDRRMKPEVDRFLAMSPVDPEFGLLGRKFAKDRCVPAAMASVEMRFDAMLFRYGLFEARYRIEFGRSPAPSVADLPPLDVDAEFNAAGFDPSGQSTLPPVVIFLRQLGECVMRVDVANSHAMIVAQPYSKQEATALAALMPALEGCMPEGHTMKFSRPMLRGAMAEALYKTATRPHSAGAAN